MSEVREGLVENDDGFDLVLVDQKEKVTHLEDRQRERKENDRNMAGDRAGEGESAICLAWQQLGGLPLQVLDQEGKHHHSSTSRSTFIVNSFGGIRFTSKSFESHGFHAST